jgi:hypothetical protein
LHAEQEVEKLLRAELHSDVSAAHAPASAPVGHTQSKKLAHFVVTCASPAAHMPWMQLLQLAGSSCPLGQFSNE